MLNKAIAEIKKKTEISFVGFTVHEKEGRKVSKLKFEFVVDEEEFSGDEEVISSLSDADAAFLKEFDETLPPKKNKR